MANYRPISNLSFLSKIVEKYVSMQLIMYLEENSLLPAQQSGFRKHHSTESLLTRILADMFLAVDKGHVTLLALFDVSAAFDTVGHGILLERPETSFGVVGRPLSWLRAFLTGVVCLWLWVPPGRTGLGLPLVCLRDQYWVRYSTFYIRLICPLSSPFWGLRHTNTLMTLRHTFMVWLLRLSLWWRKCS